MKCQKCKADNPDESIYCNECGNKIKQENTIVKEKHKKSAAETFANVTMPLIIIIPVIFIVRLMSKGFNISELFHEGSSSIGILSLITLVGLIFLLLSLWGLGIKLRLETFNNCEKYPYNDYFIKICKLHMIRMEDLSDSIGFFEASVVTNIFDLFLIPLVAAIIVFDSVWGYPFKFIIELIILIITLIIFFMQKVYPDKVNKKLTNDIRTAEGFKTFYHISVLNAILSLIAIIIHVML